MTRKVALVTDSTAYLPEEQLSQYTIRVAPQVLVWGDENFRDGIDIRPKEFYQRLANAKVMPSTSQASPQTFQEIFTDLLDQDYDVLAVLVSAKLSGTLNSAYQAQELLPQGAPVTILDSNSVAMAMGFQVLAAARAAEEGASLKECQAVAEQARENTGVVFAVNTLEFLHRGGRIGGAARLFGTALNIKPILEIQDGAVEPVERVRTRKKSLQRLLEIVAERIGQRDSVHLSALHANAPEDVDQILSMARERFEAVEYLQAPVSPVVGTHTGPGTVGLAFMAGM